MEDIPIEIHIPKLLDWLISRGHCKKEWQENILPIREKINNAIQDMPEHKEIAELLSGTYINYFHCCRIVEILKETEADTKNVFGRYGSKRMKDWQEIVYLYQKDNVYLAEAANLLFRTSKYEVPSLKKQLAKMKQIQMESDKKSMEYEKSVISNQRELDTMCKQLGIPGKNVRGELWNRISHLDEIYDRVMANIKLLQNPLKYYALFSNHIAGIPITLPLIEYLIDNGNTTLHEWIYGEAPQKVEPLMEDQVTDKHEKADNTGDIDWDVLDEKVVEDEIDWGISEVNEAIDEITLEESGIVVEATDGTSVGKGNTDLKLLDAPTTREEFLSQLLELQSFFKMRLLEMQNESDSLATTVLSNDIQETVEDVTKMLDDVQIVKQFIMDPVAEQLHFIKHSRKYINKVTSQFEQKFSNIEKMQALKEAVILRGGEAAENEKNLRPKLRLVMDKTRQLQRAIEQDISKRYNNRHVHLIGGF